VPALLCGFAVWGMWGIITVQMLNLGFPFTQAELFTLTAIAGIAGATMRIPASFLVRLSGVYLAMLTLAFAASIFAVTEEPIVASSFIIAVDAAVLSVTRIIGTRIVIITVRVFCALAT